MQYQNIISSISVEKNLIYFNIFVWNKSPGLGIDEKFVFCTNNFIQCELFVYPSSLV